MSTVLSDKPGIQCRKKCQCIFCFEVILPGDRYDYRTGVNYGDFWQMKMHPECNAFAQDTFAPGDYEDMTERSFTRKEADAHALRLAAER